MFIVLELLILKTFSGCKDSYFFDITATFMQKSARGQGPWHLVYARDLSPGRRLGARSHQRARVVGMSVSEWGKSGSAYSKCKDTCL